MGICFYHVHQKKLSFEELGFKKQRFLEYSLIGLLIAVTFGTIEFVILKPALTVSAFESGNLLRNLVYMVLFVGVGEELLFRGVIQRDLTHAFGPAAGLVLASSVFCVMHLAWRSISELALVFFMGMIFGYLYYKTGSLTAPIIAHGVGNVMLVGVLPYLRPSSYVLMLITIIAIQLLLYYKIDRKG
jgi:membrane protease YdiL (CAAX protease family)